VTGAIAFIPPENRLATWAFGLCGACLGNGALLALLFLSLQPRPLDEQDPPAAELNVASQSVPRSQATASEADEQEVSEAHPAPERVQTGSLPNLRADPKQPQPDDLPVKPPSATALPATNAPGTALATSPAAAAPLSEAPAPGAAVAASAIPPDPLDSTPPSIPPAPEATLPSPPRLAIMRPESARIAPLADAAAVPLSEASPGRIALPEQSRRQTAPLAEIKRQPAALADAGASGAHLPPVLAAPRAADALATSAFAAQTAEASAPTQAIRAGLAFPTGTTDDVDPQSLAAFRQFQDPGQEGDSLRDGLSNLLAALPCARVQLSFDPETATLELRGHLPEAADRTPVLAALRAQMGQDITLADHMRILPRPQCGALAGIAAAGLPQSTDQITNPLLVGEDAQARVLTYSGGEKLVFELTAPEYPAYIYVDYFDAAGTVLHLMPNAHVPLAPAIPASRMQVGARDDGDPGLVITVAPPYGQEIAVAFAASHPLFPDDARRPLSEPAAPYLAELTQAVSAARARHGEFKGEWVYFLVTTKSP